MNIEKIIQEKQGTIIDVRTSGEFMGGNIPGSVNIPLREIPDRIHELKNLNAPIILCCASGARSERAFQYLAQQGIDCFNIGSWLNINNYQSQTV
jgi:phage shock protein E